MPEWTAYLMGPVGGLLGLAFGAGATAGWQFSQRTMMSMLRKQVDSLTSDLASERALRQREKDDCDNRIRQLENRIQTIDDRYTSGLERQLMQVRESSARLIDQGRIRDVDDIK